LTRAYIVHSNLYTMDAAYTGDMDLITKNIQVLSEAKDKVSDNYLPLILERLSEAQGLMYDLCGDIQYVHNGVENLEQLLSMGWETIDNYINLAMLYEELHQYEKSYKTYSRCLEKFGELYLIYKKMAFLELEVQGGLSSKDRDYKVFAEHYNKAVTLYEETGGQKDQDMELQLLIQNYKTLEEGGWIHED